MSKSQPVWPWCLLPSLAWSFPGPCTRRDALPVDGWVVCHGTCMRFPSHNTLPPAGWPETAEMDSCWILEARSAKSRCQQSHTPSQTCRRESFLPSFSFYLFPATLDILWLVDTFTQISASPVTWLSFSMCVSVFLLYGHQSYWPKCLPYYPTHLNKLDLQRPYFQRTSPSKVLGVRTSTCSPPKWGHDSTHNSRLSSKLPFLANGVPAL